MGKKSEPPATKLDETARQAYNYAVLARHDPKIAQVFLTSSICNVYQFDLEDGEWKKLHYQGPMFIYSRAPRDTNDPGDALKYPYGLFVLNRLGIENFTLGITPTKLTAQSDGQEMQVKYEDPFIMVQASDGAMYGLWLFSEEDRTAVTQTLNWCLNPTEQKNQ
ncbi:mRNA-decapping enzyme subunit 1 [Trichomonascus vanleenenianus]|uniref:Dcp1p n=1 Tax=Trichomonascus vanleenenianus TaxID=2268995 RepID=UPI003EC9AAFA